MVITTHRNKASGHNHDHNDIDNGDPVVTTTDFLVTTTNLSATIALPTSGDKYLVSRYHTILYVALNGELLVLSHGWDVTYTTLRTTTADVQPLHPTTVGIHSPNATIARV